MVAPSPLEDLSRTDGIGGSSALWQELEHALFASGALEPPIPPIRDRKHDFVRDGVLMSDVDVQRAQQQLDSFMQLVPSYPSQSFAGEGIVTISGGLSYIAPSYVMLSMLRRCGCSLPVEMWFHSDELPPRPLRWEFENELFANLRSFGEISSAVDHGNFKGYKAKVIALLFSQFERVLWMDADNVPVMDVGKLLHTSEFAETGAVFWKDVWFSSSAPDLWRIIRVPQSAHPSNAHESGQMAIDKRKGWKALLLAMLFNMQEPLYKRLMTNYLGQGDKESFPIAWLTLGLPYHLVQDAPTRIGQWSKSGGSAFLTRALGQRSPAGELAFVHNNVHKFDLALPADFNHYQRRWNDFASLSAEEDSFTYLELNEHAGFDVEKECFNALVRLRCKPWFDRYVAVRRRIIGEVGLFDLGRNAEYSVKGFKGVNLDDHAKVRHHAFRIRG